MNTTLKPADQGSERSTGEGELDLLASLGVVLPSGTGAKRAPVECGQRPPKAKAERHTNWSNIASFSFTGYVARVERVECEACGEATEILEGIFIEETHIPSGTRRLQQMAKGGQWPQGGGHRKEVASRTVECCAKCVGELGFDRLVKGGEQAKALVKLNNPTTQVDEIASIHRGNPKGVL